MSGEERLKRPAPREELPEREAPVARSGPRPPVLMTPVQELTREDTARMPRDIAEAVKAWCKRNLRPDEKIHRDDLWRAVRLTPAERERWNAATVHLRTGADSLSHVSRGYWKLSGSGSPTFERRVRAGASPRHTGRLIVDGVHVPFINLDGFEVSRNGEVSGLRVVVPHTTGSEPLTKMDELFNLTLDMTQGLRPDYKRTMIYETVRERVNRSKLFGAWIASMERSPDDSTSTYVIVFDKAERM